MGKSPTFALPDAGVAKLADAPDLGSGAARHVGSTPIARTQKLELNWFQLFHFSHNAEFALKSLTVRRAKVNLPVARLYETLTRPYQDLNQTFSRLCSAYNPVTVW